MVKKRGGCQYQVLTRIWNNGTLTYCLLMWMQNRSPTPENCSMVSHKVIITTNPAVPLTGSGPSEINIYIHTKAVCEYL